MLSNYPPGMELLHLAPLLSQVSFPGAKLAFDGSNEENVLPCVSLALYRVRSCVLPRCLSLCPGEGGGVYTQ